MKYFFGFLTSVLVSKSVIAQTAEDSIKTTINKLF